MIILDTNVVSKRFRPRPDPAVLGRLERHDDETLFLHAPGWAELLSGVAFLARARSIGAAVAMLDGQIAAVALAHGFAVVTRDTAPFEAACVPVINPWLDA